MATKDITIVYTKKKMTKTGKPFLSIKDQDETWYNCFKDELLTDLQSSAQASIVYETENGYHTITGLGGTSNGLDGLGASLGLDTATEPHQAPMPRTAPMAAVMPKALEREVATLVDERKYAMNLAHQAFAGEKMEKAKLIAHADWIIKYLHGEATTASATPNPAEEFIK